MLLLFLFGIWKRFFDRRFIFVFRDFWSMNDFYVLNDIFWGFWGIIVGFLLKFWFCLVCLVCGIGDLRFVDWDVCDWFVLCVVYLLFWVFFFFICEGLGLLVWVLEWFVEGFLGRLNLIWVLDGFGFIGLCCDDGELRFIWLWMFKFFNLVWMRFVFCWFMVG